MNRKQSPRGFTLVEIMIVVAILALLVTIAVPAWLRAVYLSRNTKFINDCRVFGDAVEIFAAEKNYYPEDGSSGVIPEGLAPYLESVKWDLATSGVAGTAIGGVWDLETNDSNVGCAVGAVGSGDKQIAEDFQLGLLEERDDDGDFSLGLFRKIRPGGYYMIIVPDPVIVQDP